MLFLDGICKQQAVSLCLAEVVISLSIRHISLSLLLSYPACAAAQAVSVDFDALTPAALALEALRAAPPQAPSFQSKDQGVREYILEGYPKGTEPCVAIAARIGADVARAAGVKVVRAYCASEDANGFVIKVAYEASEPIRPVSTLSRGGGFGTFPGRQECEAALAIESRAFADATGLEPVVSYCLRDTRADKDAWSIRIDSFGSPQLKPQTWTVPIFTRPDGVSRAVFLGGIEQKLWAQGVPVRFVVWKPVSGYAELGVSYYAAQRLEFAFNEPAKFDAKAQCQAALVEMSPLLAARTPEPLAFYCGQQMIGGWELAWMFKNAPSLKTAMASDSFKSYADCLAKRAQVAEYYRQSLGHQVVGAICSREVLEFAWKVILLED